MPEERRELALIAVDLGSRSAKREKREDEVAALAPTQRASLLDVVRLRWVRQLETYLANWAAYNDYR